MSNYISKVEVNLVRVGGTKLSLTQHTKPGRIDESIPIYTPIYIYIHSRNIYIYIYSIVDRRQWFCLPKKDIYDGDPPQEVVTHMVTYKKLPYLHIIE